MEKNTQKEEFSYAYIDCANTSPKLTAVVELSESAVFGVPSLKTMMQRISRGEML